MTSVVESPDREFLDAAGAVLRAATPGEDPLEALGWWDLLAEFDDTDARGAALALFRAQGRELADTAALGALLAQPYLAATGSEPGTLVAVIARRSARGERFVAVGDVAGRALLVDRPGQGASVIPAEKAELVPVTVPGRLTLHEVRVDDTALTPVVTEADAVPARARGLFLGRIAASLEILGAAEQTAALAVAYAGSREQFGRPIGTFQAVRHLLAWAQTDCVALESVVTTAVALDDAAPERHDEVVKALAGRNGRRICERTMQVLGGIGFTAEHDHHLFHSRVLALDALLGTSAELTYALGAWWRESRGDPSAPVRALLAGAGS
ncbi:acyl-CoA dehydrogenase family protein [Frankia sp. R82]|uniref:acyl-CoA dehydrogenase family protein n=1 Tax=Frankia sp. R82 TaxID=2950553 RepID=UPI002043E247|nr:acyl-CoA dehydrogenase family protein [Frankia sp. R82]MCM3882699.1 acyl-CoA dehydrogenase [Frankia sp. R82]